MASDSKTIDQIEKLKVLCHRQDINKNIAAAFRSVERGDPEDMKRHLYAIQQNILGFEQYLSVTIEPKHYAQFRQANSTIAAKVFAVPELLESILKELTVPALMRCYSVNRTFRDALETSKKLQACLFLLPDTESREQRFPLNNIERFVCTAPRPEFGRGSMIDVRTRVGRIYKIGPRWKKMLVSQPPTYSMQYYAICFGSKPGGCRLGGWARGDRQNLHSNKGLTIGDLFEAVETMANAHRGCVIGHNDVPRVLNVTFEGPGNEDSL